MRTQHPHSAICHTSISIVMFHFIFHKNSFSKNAKFISHLPKGKWVRGGGGAGRALKMEWKLKTRPNPTGKGEGHGG